MNIFYCKKINSDIDLPKYEMHRTNRAQFSDLKVCILYRLKGKRRPHANSNIRKIAISRPIFHEPNYPTY